MSSSTVLGIIPKTLGKVRAQSLRTKSVTIVVRESGQGISAGDGRVTDVAAPTAYTHGANKQYVDETMPATPFAPLTIHTDSVVSPISRDTYAVSTTTVNGGPVAVYMTNNSRWVLSNFDSATSEYSDDRGEIWQTSSLGSTGQMVFAYSPTLEVLAARALLAPLQAKTSTDGITFSAQSAPTTYAESATSMFWDSVNEQFLLGVDNAANYIEVSSNGTSWAPSTAAPRPVEQFAQNTTTGTIVTCGASGFMRSTDGTTFSNSSNYAATTVAYSPQLDTYVAYNSATGDAYVCVDDGVSWYACTNGPWPASLSSMIWVDTHNVFVLAGESASNTLTIHTSPIGGYPTTTDTGVSIASAPSSVSWDETYGRLIVPLDTAGANAVFIGNGVGIARPTLVSQGLRLSENLELPEIVSAPPPVQSDAGILYVENGALKYRGTSGTITTIAAS